MIDETIVTFQGHVKKIVQILFKFTPKGFKLWVLSDHKY